MMWWAENAIIMKFTRGKTHNVTIHIKPCCGKMNEKIKCEQNKRAASQARPKFIHTYIHF